MGGCVPPIPPRIDAPDIFAECEICDKYDGLISRKVVIIKQQQLYKLTVISLTVISKWNDSNIIYSIKTLIGILKDINKSLM